MQENYSIAQQIAKEALVASEEVLTLDTLMRLIRITTLHPQTGQVYLFMTSSY